MNIDANLAELQKLYKEIDSKNRLFDLVAKRLGKKTSHVRVNYFQLWNIPKKQQEPIKKILNSVIKLQNKFNINYKSLENK